MLVSAIRRLILQATSARRRRVRRIGGRKHGDLGIVGRVAQRSEQVERAWHRELRGAESGHEVAAADAGRVSSMPFSTGYTMPNPPATSSAATASRVTTPWRASNCWVTAAAHFVVSAALTACRRLTARGTPERGPSPSVSADLIAVAPASTASADGGASRLIETP